MIVPGYLLDLLEAGVVTATAGVVVFIVQWTLTSPWWHDQVGRTVVAKDFALLVLLVPNCIRTFWHSALSPLFIGWMDAGALVAVAVIMVWRCLVWYRIEKPSSPVAMWRRYQSIRSHEGRHSR